MAETRIHLGKVLPDYLQKGKVDGRYRIFVKGAGFSNGDTVLYLRHGSDIYLAKLENIVGIGTVDKTGRASMGREVAELLELKEGDRFGILEDEEIEITLKTNLRLVKVFHNGRK